MAARQDHELPRRRLPLVDLFLYPTLKNPKPWEGADHYWKGGISMLAEETMIHEALTSALLTREGLGDEIAEDGGEEVN